MGYPRLGCLIWAAGLAEGLHRFDAQIDSLDRLDRREADSEIPHESSTIQVTPRRPQHSQLCWAYNDSAASCARFVDSSNRHLPCDQGTSAHRTDQVIIMKRCHNSANLHLQQLQKREIQYSSGALKVSITWCLHSVIPPSVQALFSFPPFDLYRTRH